LIEVIDLKRGQNLEYYVGKLKTLGSAEVISFNKCSKTKNTHLNEHN